MEFKKCKKSYLLYRKSLKVKREFLYKKHKNEQANRKEIDKFLMDIYSKGITFQNVKSSDLKFKKIITNIKQLRHNKNIKYYRFLPKNIKNSVIILSKSIYIAPKYYKQDKNNIFIYLGADIGIDELFSKSRVDKKSMKIIFLHEDNYYTRELVKSLFKKIQ